MLYRYKPEEGRNARQASFWLGEAMIAYGCWAFRGFLNRWESLREPVSSAVREVPVLGTTLSTAVVAATVLFLVLTAAWVRFIARQRVADHLIEVETEVRKVTWPSFKEASNSSVVVIVTVLVLMAFLAASDFVLGSFFKVILWRGVATP